MDLNTEQKAAVETESKKALLISGAGSGKTRTLIERIAYLVEKCKVSPSEILAFSFTRLASKEIRDRLEQRMGRQVSGCTLGTMHGIVLQMIQKFGETINLRPGHISIYSQWESDFMLKQIAIETGVYKKSWNPRKKDIDAVFADYYERAIEPEKENPAYNIFKVFIARCRENNALTYGALLIGMELLIPTMAKYLHLKHILVDEVQDIDPLQWQIINKMCDAFGASLFVVGDIQQSVYSFRGAVPEYLIEHEQEFDVYRLENNYRSDKHIVDAANNLIKNNEMRLPLEMKAIKDAQTPITIKNNLTSAGIVGMYMSMVEQAPGLKAAILARNHFLLKKMSQIMEEAEISHTYIGKETELTNSEEFRRFHAFLKLIVNPFDNFAFLLIKDLVDLSISDYADIRLRAAREGRSHFQAWHEEFTATPFEDAESHGKNSLNGISDSIDAIFKSKNENWKSETSDFIYNWLLENPTGTAEGYLSWLATMDVQDEIKKDIKGVQLSTIHGCKGLEFDTVIIAGLNEGILPSKKAAANDEIQDERRLCYVGITRAKNKLIITTRPETSEFHGKVRIEPVSRFVGEMEV